MYFCIVSNFFYNKTVWITGASSGIGEALAYAFIRKNAKIYISARNKEKLNDVYNNCLAIDNNARCTIIPLDITNSENIQIAVKEVFLTTNKLDYLINNAGTSQRSFAINTPVEIDRQIMELNFFGTVTLTKEVLVRMIHSGGGTIAVTSSIVGKFGFPMRTAYAASKHALQGYFESLRTEVAKQNVNINIIIPGRIKTNVSVNAITENGNPYGKMDTGQEKGMSPEQCAKKILKGIQYNKKEILVGKNELLMVYIRRLFPFLYYKLAGKIKN